MSDAQYEVVRCSERILKPFKVLILVVRPEHGDLEHRISLRKPPDCRYTEMENRLINTSFSVLLFQGNVCRDWGFVTPAVPFYPVERARFGTVRPVVIKWQSVVLFR